MSNNKSAVKNYRQRLMAAIMDILKKHQKQYSKSGDLFLIPMSAPIISRSKKFHYSKTIRLDMAHQFVVCCLRTDGLMTEFPARLLSTDTLFIVLMSLGNPNFNQHKHKFDIWP